MTRRDVDLSDRLALTVAEAAEAVGVSERHFRSMLSEIPHVYIGNRVVIPIEQFKEWLRKRAEAQGARADAVVEEVLEELENDG